MINVGKPLLQPLELLTCTIGGEDYCIEAAAVGAIKHLDVMRRNHEGDAPVGWLAVDDDEISVYDLAGILGKQRRELDRKCRVVLLNTGVGLFAALIERIKTIVQAPAEKVFPLSPCIKGQAARLFKGVVELDGKLTLLLRPDGFVFEMPAAENNRVTSPLIAPAAAPPLSGRMLVFTVPAAEAQTEPVLFGLELQAVLEIIERPIILPVPRAQKQIHGLIRWRDRPVPVIGLRTQLGLPAATAVDENCRLLIARIGAQSVPVALPIDQNARMHRCTASEPAHPEIRLRPDWVRGVYDLNGVPLIVPNLGEMFG